MESTKADFNIELNTKQQQNFKNKREKCYIAKNIHRKNSPDNNKKDIEAQIYSKTHKSTINTHVIPISTEITKVTNFEYEDEWDVGGIPQLLNDLDADIEKSLNIDRPQKTKESSCSKFLTHLKNGDVGTSSRLEYSSNLGTSTFAGFSKGGHLISNSATPLRLYPYARKDIIATSSFVAINENIGMSTQSGNGSSNTTVNISREVLSNSSGVSGSQGVCNSNASSKSSAKMSIDHQATLDKGLKMKIKRTKPGTKSSEAKHEIVKATDQQNGLITDRGNISCNSNIEEHNTPSSSPSLNSQNSTNNPATSSSINIQSSNNSCGNKKTVTGSNQITSINVSLNAGNTSTNAGTSATNCLPSSQSSKRSNSSHRREKVKDKTSNRIGGDKSSTLNIEKESHDKCLCSCTENNTAQCPSNTCVRLSENCTLTPNQRSAISAHNNSVPPGVFIPSADAPSTTVSTASLLSISSVPTSPTSIILPPSNNGGSANTPGPPCKDTTSNNGNIKISSHIAAQLAAAAASGIPNGSNVSTLQVEGKTSAPVLNSTQDSKPGPGLISATVHHTKSIPSSANIINEINTFNSNTNIQLQFPCNITASASNGDSARSPPAKKSKLETNKSTGTLKPTKKDMVDICVGTSIGTITEPDCLGPCEPGTSVTLEGIVWHETEGGVLVVNVTWRGKTYVGTLLDCTRHDWAPPRFCDSPTDELDARTPKGRGKRSRSTTMTPDLSNFTETRSSIKQRVVHAASGGISRTAQSNNSALSAGLLSIASTETVITSPTIPSGAGASTTLLLPKTKSPMNKQRGPEDSLWEFHNIDNFPFQQPTSSYITPALETFCSDGRAGSFSLKFNISDQIHSSLRDIAQEILPLASHYTCIQKLIQNATNTNCTQVLQALNAALGNLLHDYYIYFSHSQVHSKLRNGSNKGRCSTRVTGQSQVIDKASSSSVATANGVGSTPSTSPTSFLPPRLEKRKSKDEPSSPGNANDFDNTSVNMVNASGISITACGGGLASQPQSLINPVTGLNVQITTKKCKPATPCAVSPVLLECPEQDCSKKYKHANGLRYHQSHAHGATSTLDDESVAEPNEVHSLTPSGSSILSSAATANVSEIQSSLVIPQIPSPTEPIEATSIITDLNEEREPLKFNERLDNNKIYVATTSSENEHVSDTLNLSDSPLVLPSVSTKANINFSSNSVSQKHTAESESVSNVDALLSLEDKSEALNLQMSPGTASVLRFPQIETENSATIKSANHELNASQLEPNDANLISSYNDGSGKEPPTSNQHNSVKSSVISITGKQKKNRKSSESKDYEEQGVYNIVSRDDVQSPAYSDISDDSTPINELDLIEKPLEKRTETNKKINCSSVPSVTSCKESASQHALTSTLGNFGVYQFYQQQQFLVEPQSSDQSQLNKTSLPINDNQSMSAMSGNQQQSPKHSEYCAKKEHSSDTLTKNSVSTQQMDLNNDLSQSLSNTGSVTTGIITSNAPSKTVSNFYGFNYMSPNYQYNVDANYGTPPLTSADEPIKLSHASEVMNPNDKSHSPGAVKDDRPKEELNFNENRSVHQLQFALGKLVKTESSLKPETIKQELSMSPSQIHHQMHSKDVSGMGVYSNMYQRHPVSLASHQLTREEEFRRYYLFSDQQRRQNSALHNINMLQQNQSSSTQSKDDNTSVQQQTTQNLQNNSQSFKIKTVASTNLINSGNKGNTLVNKECLKSKIQEDDVKVIKQEGQKPTMETQGPPPPPTSQYFLHPSYIAPTPFGFDPNHPMYRNVLMPASSPYNSSPYHMPMTRYHAPEDLSRNSGTKALDALHHAATQYYSNHKIHELSERALKSPNSGGNNGSNNTKVSGSSPNINTTQQSNINIGNQINTNSPSVSLPSQAMLISSNKQEISQKSHLTNSQGSEIQKQSNSSHILTGGNGNPSNSSSSSVGNSNNNGSATDSRSPPPQRHVHTHHHTHVGLGYPMYPAPYGAAVLASQQAAAVAVINPFPPGPTK